MGVMLDQKLRVEAIRHTTSRVLRLVNGTPLPIWSLVAKLSGGDLRAIAPGESVGDFVEFLVKEGLLAGDLGKGVILTEQGKQFLEDLSEA